MSLDFHELLEYSSGSVLTALVVVDASSSSFSYTYLFDRDRFNRGFLGDEESTCSGVETRSGAFLKTTGRGFHFDSEHLLEDSESILVGRHINLSRVVLSYFSFSLLNLL